MMAPNCPPAPRENGIESPGPVMAKGKPPFTIVLVRSEILPKLEIAGTAPVMKASTRSSSMVSVSMPVT
jgi:hypothetical protein